MPDGISSSYPSASAIPKPAGERPKSWIHESDVCGLDIDVSSCTLEVRGVFGWSIVEGTLADVFVFRHRTRGCMGSRHARKSLASVRWKVEKSRDIIAANAGHVKGWVSGRYQDGRIVC